MSIGKQNTVLLCNLLYEHQTADINLCEEHEFKLSDVKYVTKRICYLLNPLLYYTLGGLI